MSIKTVSLFSGCGGFDWGVQQAGAKIIWANDIDSMAASAYKSLFRETEFVLGDIRQIKSIPSADILIGCYPCTGFSEAARRRSQTGQERNLHKNDKNFLFEEFLRTIDTVRPKFLMVENVRGMLSAGGGWFIDRQLKAFSEKGYKVKYSQLDAADYGIPQNRKRVFLIGTHVSLDNFEYRFPSPTHGTDDTPIPTLFDAIHDLPNWPQGEFFEQSFHGHFLTRNRKRRWNQPSYTIVANAHHVPLHPEGDPMVFVEKDRWTLQGEFNRRLSWRECQRLQGLPNDIQLTGSLIDKYRVIGNSVPPALSKALAQPIVNYLKTLS
jgi:DNA (cytosine-5)-methyltransferase 1